MFFNFGRLAWVVLQTVFFLLPARAEIFGLPTSNRAIFEPGGEARYFVGTVGKPWTSGAFGCVRSDGRQMHEGLDIRCVRHDRAGEPADPVFATADGVVAYINNRPSLSNYGRYVIIKHQIEGIEIYSVYAHLSVVAENMRAGRAVRKGETIATMGRTTNTRQGISKDRAHVHFELNLFLNEKFANWHEHKLPGQRNDHGAWNGHNLVGLDPLAILHEQQRQGAGFSLVKFVRAQTPLCRVLVRATGFPFSRRYAPLIRPSSAAEKEGVAGYEVTLNFNGVPCDLVSRAASELKNTAGKTLILSVNEAEQERNPCRRLLLRRGGQWELSATGQRLIDLLTF